MKLLKTSPNSPRHRRIGRKVLLADRLAHATKPKKSSSRRVAIRLPSFKTKTVAVISLAVVIIGSIGFGASQVYFAQAATAQKAAEEKQQKENEAKSAAADACRREKVKEKADQVGKVTFDELYGDCNS